MFAHERRLHLRFPFPSSCKFRLNALAHCGNRFDISPFGALSEAKLLHLDFFPKERCSLEMLQLNDDSLFAIEGSTFTTPQCMKTGSASPRTH